MNIQPALFRSFIFRVSLFTVIAALLRLRWRKIRRSRKIRCRPEATS